MSTISETGTFVGVEDLPLRGVRVLDLSHMMQGPWATEMLADLGADVIKVEHVRGGERGRQSGTTEIGGHSAFYLAMNRNKRSLALDLKAPAGLAIARDLVARADVLVQNFRPGVIDRLGLGWTEVHALNPGLIYCSGSGYGADQADRPGQDLLAQARSGAMALTGHHGGPPAPSGPFVADAHAASMLALGVCAALFDRTRTGLGRHFEIDLIGSMLHQMTQELVSHHNGDRPTRRSPSPSNPFMEGPYGVYATSDGWIAISMCPTADLARALERPDLHERFPDKATALERRDELVEDVSALLAPRTTADALATLESNGVWCAPVNDLDAMTTDPVVGWAGRHTTVPHPGIGPVDLVLNPLSLDGRRLPVRRPAPLHGEHSAEVLAELGLDQGETELLARDGVVHLGGAA
ncbi:CaiB/BaiF CoA transferase family protein [Occultella gossypii]|uniref:CoA transferase n=1 Tax=Occultella gossypii TaxID=2800820 RepID=A0ABS7S8N0_9MICO|nr:CoA transferase [Occultella gossypii]MBZ2195563.1 CoA transferase [Occultella gossypii]